MDTSARDITFNEMGVCNYCTEFLQRSSHIIHEDVGHKQARLNVLVNQVKAQGQGKSYDCIVGVSGGIDSSWALVEVMRLGLRPLAVHMDNGWNSELAQNNISNLVRTLGVDLHTHVIDWREYRALMQAFFDADVVDVELLYDNAMLAVNYSQAKKFNIKYILSGTNEVTEGMKMPPDWNWFKYDKKNIKSIAKINNVKLQSFPAIGTFNYVVNKFLKGIQWISFLDYLPFNKLKAIEELESKFGFKRYPYKHYESIFTRFYQGYILPEKFKIDKRKLHFSSLISSGQLNRNDAIQDLLKIAYPSTSDLESDFKYFLKKMNWSESDLITYLKRPSIRHDFYPSEKQTWNFLHMVKSKFSNK